MVINERPASHETAICQWLSSPGTTANQRPSNMTSLARDCYPSANKRAGNNNQATSLWRIQASIKPLLPCFFLFHYCIFIFSAILISQNTFFCAIKSYASNFRWSPSSCKLIPPNLNLIDQSTNKHRQNGQPRIHLLQDHPGCRLCLCCPGQVLLWQGVCSPLHLQQGFLWERDLRPPLLLPYVDSCW